MGFCAILRSPGGLSRCMESFPIKLARQPSGRTLRMRCGIEFTDRSGFCGSKLKLDKVYTPLHPCHTFNSQFRLFCIQSKDDKGIRRQETSDKDEYRNLSLFQKFKAMYRDYWYVLVPVHLSSSAVFLGIFYYAASSGIDVVALLEKLNVGESILSPLRDSSAGYIAITYALYKIFTPVRYTVTLGGTTWAIKFLTTRGLIKPRSMKDAKQNVQNIITAMKLPEHQRQKFLEDKGMPRLGKAVGQASAPSSGKNHTKQN